MAGTACVRPGGCLRGPDCIALMHLEIGRVRTDNPATPLNQDATVESLADLNPNFDHNLESDNSGYARIKSACKLCGAFVLASVSDGSLEEWESGHECQQGGRGPS